MQEVLQWGADIVVWFQQLSPTLDKPFILISATGTELFMLLVLPLISWSISSKVGIRLLLLVLINTYINTIAKLLLNQPRPFDFDPRVQTIEHAKGGGLPSGHTQNAVVFWSYLATSFKRKWLWGLAITMMIFVPLSRVYLGAHFPTDLLGALVLGLLTLFLFIRLEQIIIHWLKSKTVIIQLSLAVIVPIVMLTLSPVTDPAIIGICGVLMGGFIGLVIEQRWIKYQPPEDNLKKIYCYLIGILGLFSFYVGLKLAFTNLEPAPIFRFIRYSVVGFHLTFIAPWIFTKLQIK